MKPFSYSLFTILFFNILTTFQAFCGPKKNPLLIEEENRSSTGSQLSYAEIARRKTSEKQLVEVEQPKPAVALTLGTEERKEKNDKEENIESLLQQKRQEMETLKSQLQLLENGAVITSVDNYNKLANLSAAFNRSQDAIRAAYQLRDFMNDYAQKGIPLGNDCYQFLETIAKINEQNARNAYIEFNTFSKEIQNSSATQQYQKLIQNALTQAEFEISRLQIDVTRARSLTMTSDLESEISALTDNTGTTGSRSSGSLIVHQKATSLPPRITVKDRELEQVKKFITDNQWYTCANGKYVPTEDPTLRGEDADHAAKVEIASPMKDISSLAAPLDESDKSDQSEEEQTDDEQISSLPSALEELHLKTTPPPTHVKQRSKKSKKKKSISKDPSQSPKKSDADWETEVKKKYPLHLFDLGEYNFHQFQENAARLAKSLIEKPEYLYLFKNLGDSFCEGIKQLIKYNYIVTEDDTEGVVKFKLFLKTRVNEEYYPRYLTEKIRLAKIEAEENEKRISRAEEAAKELLASLEAEARFKKQQRKNNSSNQSKSRKK